MIRVLKCFLQMDQNCIKTNYQQIQVGGKLIQTPVVSAKNQNDLVNLNTLAILSFLLTLRCLPIGLVIPPLQLPSSCTIWSQICLSGIAFITQGDNTYYGNKKLSLVILVSQCKSLQRLAEHDHRRSLMVCNCLFVILEYCLVCYLPGG